MEVQQDRPTLEQLRQRVITAIGKDGSGLRRLLGPALPPVIDARIPSVAG